MSLERRTPLRRTGRLRQLSPRTAERRAEIAEASAAAIARDRACVARSLVPDVRCWGPLDPQHVIPRSTAPSLVADVENIVAVCRSHHEWIGAEPVAARRLGLHGHAGDDLAELARRRAVAR